MSWHACRPLSRRQRIDQLVAPPATTFSDVPAFDLKQWVWCIHRKPSKRAEIGPKLAGGLSIMTTPSIRTRSSLTPATIRIAIPVLALTPRSLGCGWLSAAWPGLHHARAEPLEAVLPFPIRLTRCLWHSVR
jgi:hypothetical protein